MIKPIDHARERGSVSFRPASRPPRPEAQLHAGMPRHGRRPHRAALVHESCGPRSRETEIRSIFHAPQHTEGMHSRVYPPTRPSTASRTGPPMTVPSSSVATSRCGCHRRRLPLGAPGRRHSGGQRQYSDVAIETALTLRLLFHLPLRQTEGFLHSLFGMMGLQLAAPNHTTLSRRGQRLDVACARVPTDRGLHLIVDSTGLSIVGEGEWARAKLAYAGRAAGRSCIWASTDRVSSLPTR